MTTIRAYTTIEQGRKLAEILPLESADMHYNVNRYDNEYKIFMIPYSELGSYKDNEYQYSVCAWSLAALLGVLPMIRKGEDTANPFIAKTPDNEYYVVYATLTEEVDSSAIYDNPIDACVEMIIHLHELNLL